MINKEFAWPRRLCIPNVCARRFTAAEQGDGLEARRRGMDDGRASVLDLPGNTVSRETFAGS